MSDPGYWKNETGGRLRPAVEAYLSGEQLSPEQIATIRAYLRQWINAGVWDQNPNHTDDSRGWLDDMRSCVDGLTSQEAIKTWIKIAITLGMDPL